MKRTLGVRSAHAKTAILAPRRKREIASQNGWPVGHVASQFLLGYGLRW